LLLFLKLLHFSRNDSVEREEESASKRSLKSHVVSTSWETKQRNQVLEEQKNDTKSLNRNKRMFGMILGTLEKFKSEESQRKDTVIVPPFTKRISHSNLYLYSLETRRNRKEVGQSR